jgi:ATP-dependent Lon protease
MPKTRNSSKTGYTTKSKSKTKSKSNTKSKAEHRVSPFQPHQLTIDSTVDGDHRSLNGDTIDDPSLVDLMGRIGTLNKSEQRRLMVKYRKYIEENKTDNKTDNKNNTIQNIITRFPKVQQLQNVLRYNGNNGNKSVKISTRKSKNTSLNKDEVVYKGHLNTKSKSRKPIKKTPKHMSPFKEDVDTDKYDLDYNPDKSDDDTVSDYSIESEMKDFIVRENYEDHEDYNYRDEPITLQEELNNLVDDVPKSRKRKRRSVEELESMDSITNDNYFNRITEIRENYDSRKIDMKCVIEAKFNADDTNWFYSRIRRFDKMENDKYKFELEDSIQKKFNTLNSLKNANLYQKLNRPAERNIITEILDSDKPDDMKQIMISRMMSVPTDIDDEYNKALSWLDTIFSIPTKCKNVIGLDDNDTDVNFGSVLFKLKQNLDSNLYGMGNVKREILQAVNTMYNDPDMKGKIITLVGSPGVGKTTIANLIAETIGMGFGQIACGSIADRSVIMGQTSTYIGSKTGIFTNILIKTGQLNNVILLDELDKLPDSSLLPILLQILDKQQNFRFKDYFCPEIDIDMSKNLYILAVNDVSCFHKALRDRMKVIEVNGYNTDEKTAICFNHIIPNIQKKTGLKPCIKYNTLRYFVNKVSPTISGVRDIIRYFEDIYEKLQLIHRFTEYLKSDNNALKYTLSVTNSTEPYFKETGSNKRAKKAKRSTSKTKTISKTISNTPETLEDLDSLKFREIIKTHLNIDLIEGIDLRFINSIEFLSVNLIESLEN